jgi:uncharacterized repeat protein (TIGR03803 family)
MLRNPCYAGAFAYGKTVPRTVIEEGRARQVSRYRKPQEERKVLLVDHHPGYISWKDYAENQRRLEANVARTQGEASGAAKVGRPYYRDCCAADVALLEFIRTILERSVLQVLPAANYKRQSGRVHRGSGGTIPQHSEDSITLRRRYMARRTQHRSWVLGTHVRAASAALVLAVMLVPAFLTTGSAQAQTYTESVLYTFKGPPDGANPTAGLVRDAQGNLYGTTWLGGAGYGTAFNLDTTGKETVLHSFTGTPEKARKPPSQLPGCACRQMRAYFHTLDYGPVGQGLSPTDQKAFAGLAVPCSPQ